ncbi:MAG TPA: MotA/TolQ/ExbB proton channel family protein [Candidatus Polarisedimenticolia bacterium]|nr:MotA/TolQ/ExbB proton channel family protein [Candidatus Polarisedimenticolia bacterium]
MGEFGPLEMWHSMGIPAKTVAFFLLIMSVWSIAVMFEKFLSYRAAVKQSVEFLPIVTKALRNNDLVGAIDASKKYPKSHLAKVLSAGLQEFLNEKDGGVSVDVVEAVKRALERATVLTSAELKSKLGGLGTIGSTAPFIGLFGTVLGVITAFQGMAKAGSGGLGAVSAGIAEALIETAFGLFVAIPAVMAYNYFQGRIERFEVEMSNSASSLIDFFLKQRQNAHAR